MTKAGYKTILVKLETYMKIVELKQKENKKSIVATVSDIIKKYIGENHNE
jgi:predicted CopG family antitoxin